MYSGPGSVYKVRKPAITSFLSPLIPKRLSEKGAYASYLILFKTLDLPLTQERLDELQRGLQGLEVKLYPDENCFSVEFPVRKIQSVTGYSKSLEDVFKNLNSLGLPVIVSDNYVLTASPENETPFIEYLKDLELEGLTIESVK